MKKGLLDTKTGKIVDVVEKKFDVNPRFKWVNVANTVKAGALDEDGNGSFKNPKRPKAKKFITEEQILKRALKKKGLLNDTDLEDAKTEMENA